MVKLNRFCSHVMPVWPGVNRTRNDLAGGPERISGVPLMGDRSNGQRGTEGKRTVQSDRL